MWSIHVGECHRRASVLNSIQFLFICYRANVHGQFPYDLFGEVCSKCAAGRMCEDGLCAGILYKQIKHIIATFSRTLFTVIFSTTTNS